MDLVKLIKKCNAFYFGQLLDIISMIRLDTIGSTMYVYYKTDALCAYLCSVGDGMEKVISIHISMTIQGEITNQLVIRPSSTLVDQ